MYKYKASLDNVSKGLSAGLIFVASCMACVGLLIAFHVIQIHDKHTGALMSRAETLIICASNFGLLVIVAVIYVYKPNYYEIDQTDIRVHRRISVFKIPFENISQVSTIDNMGMTIRVFGNGGLFGYTGWFYNSRFGRMRWFATQRKNYILITLLSNKKIVLTPDEPVEFIDRLNKVMVKGFPMLGTKEL